jgi:hypothetical protein
MGFFSWTKVYLFNGIDTFAPILWSNVFCWFCQLVLYSQSGVGLGWLCHSDVTWAAGCAGLPAFLFFVCVCVWGGAILQCLHYIFFSLSSAALKHLKALNGGWCQHLAWWLVCSIIKAKLEWAESKICPNYYVTGLSNIEARFFASFFKQTLLLVIQLPSFSSFSTLW